MIKKVKFTKEEELLLTEDEKATFNVMANKQIQWEQKVNKNDMQVKALKKNEPVSDSTNRAFRRKYQRWERKVNDLSIKTHILICEGNEIQQKLNQFIEEVKKRIEKDRGD